MLCVYVQGEKECFMQECHDWNDWTLVEPVKVVQIVASVEEKRSTTTEQLHPRSHPE
jgi:hypothetical protein